MQGHRKSSCAPPDSGEGDLGVEDLPKSLKALNIASPDFIRDREMESKAFIRDRRRKSTTPAIVASDTISSLSTASNEIVARLLEPGIFDDTRVEDEAENTSRIVRWKETIAPESSKKTNIRQVMPGTLVAPTPDSSFVTLQKAESSDPTQSILRQPLSRSMSVEQRNIFMSELAVQSAATLHVISREDADILQSQAASLNIITHLIISDDKNDSHSLLVVGRDKSSVRDLVRKVKEENRKAVSPNEDHLKSPPNLKTVAGAAMIGAVGTWAGLAFS